MTLRKRQALIYIRIEAAPDARTSRVFAPMTAGADIKAAVDRQDRTWDPDRRCWVVANEAIPGLRLALHGTRYHVRLADTEPRSTLPLFRNANRRSTAA